MASTAAKQEHGENSDEGYVFSRFHNVKPFKLPCSQIQDDGSGPQWWWPPAHTSLEVTARYAPEAQEDKEKVSTLIKAFFGR